MPWTDFAEDSALERDLLRRALPVVPTASDGSSRMTIDLADNSAAIALTVSDTIGTTPAGCVDMLGLRPLLVGAAWKILDLLLETALRQDDVQPGKDGQYTIRKKIDEAKRGRGRVRHISGQAWTVLQKTYVETEELRHSLVHRRVYTDPANALVGRDDNKVPLRPLSADEQEAFVRSVLRAAELVTAASQDGRVEADLLRQLNRLSNLHLHQLPAVTVPESLREVTVILPADLADPGRYTFDLSALREKRGFTHADLIVRFNGRAGQELRGRLEDAPDDEIVTIDPDGPPAWLH